jgi:hypothetical protein
MYFKKNINEAKTKTVRRESFLPGIHDTAWVKTGWTTNIRDRKIDAALE